MHAQDECGNVDDFHGILRPQEDGCVVIVQEYAAGGDLLRYMYSQGGKLAERQAVRLVLLPFLCALEHLHEQARRVWDHMWIETVAAHYHPSMWHWRV
jgi:serine/threonine protein kinase